TAPNTKLPIQPYATALARRQSRVTSRARQCSPALQAEAPLDRTQAPAVIRTCYGAYESVLNRPSFGLPTRGVVGQIEGVVCRATNEEFLPDQSSARAHPGSTTVHPNRPKAARRRQRRDRGKS